MIRGLIAICACAFLASCHSFRVIPQPTNYVLRAPDSHETPFPDILRNYNGYEPGRSWMDLRPLIEIRIENAYYEKGFSRRGLEGFLGTEVATYETTPHGLTLLSFRPMKDRPASDPPVQQLISQAQMRHRHYRLYFEVFFKGQNAHSSVLLGSDSTEGLDQPEKVCDSNPDDCTVFPEACSVSVEMKIVVNGHLQTVLWRSRLADVVKGGAQRIQMKRLYAGRLTAVKINASDSNDLKLPLLPGDQVWWR